MSSQNIRKATGSSLWKLSQSYSLRRVLVIFNMGIVNKGYDMKKAFILFLSTLVLCFACKRGNTPSEQPHGIKPEESSRIKELKVDGDDVLFLMDKNNEVTLESVPVHKDVVSVYVLPHNPSAEIVVSNTGKRVDELDGNIYEVHLFYGKK